MNKRTLSKAAAIGLACLTLGGCVSEVRTYRGSDRFYDRGYDSDYYAYRGSRNRYPDRYRHDGRPDRNRGPSDRDHGRPNRDNDARRPDRDASRGDNSDRDRGNYGGSSGSGDQPVSGRVVGESPIFLRNR